MDETWGLVVLKEAADPVIAVDLDRTLVDDDGNLIPGAKDALNYLRESGWKIIIWTARPDLDDVRETLKKHGLPYDHINENPDKDKTDPSRKIYFNVTVDDKAVAFDGDWKKSVAELDRRRALWQLQGETKAQVRLLSVEKGDAQTVGVFALENGIVVEKSGGRSRAVENLLKSGIETDEGVVRPSEGSRFLRAMMEELQGTYLWAEIC